MSTACQQLEVFSRVLRTSLATILDGGEENLEKNLPEFAVSSPPVSGWKEVVGSRVVRCEVLLPYRERRLRSPAQVPASCSGAEGVWLARLYCPCCPMTHTPTPAVFQKMACHGEHTYLFAQAMMSVLAQEEQGGSAVRRVAQEVQRFAQEK